MATKLDNDTVLACSGLCAAAASGGRVRLLTRPNLGDLWPATVLNLPALPARVVALGVAGAIVTAVLASGEVWAWDSAAPSCWSRVGGFADDVE
jgi:hypothetical protein